MTEAEIREIAYIAAEAATLKTFQLLGVDTANPLEMQRDFGHLRDWRVTMRGIQRKLVIGFFTGAGGMGMYLLWQGALTVLKP